MRGWEGEEGREEVGGGRGGRGTKGRTRDGDGASRGGGGGRGRGRGRRRGRRSAQWVPWRRRGGGASGTASLSEGKEEDGESARRGAAGEAGASLGGLSPVLALYWRAGSEAIAPKVLGEAEGTGPLGGRPGLGARSEGRPRAGGGGEEVCR
ncbi:hypothetical protein Naga_100137g21 [Nannochloropsis gaditana]|uniref:Uncharacterized protein n=1 Tax=Nannochloropsis gaditana TaxID=72520 RepID=W7TBI4_9STRA|nr:hypothetical protein Naga_100137g21 [Nannochloropsis gaditana]